MLYTGKALSEWLRDREGKPGPEIECWGRTREGEAIKVTERMEGCN